MGHGLSDVGRFQGQPALLAVVALFREKDDWFTPDIRSRLPQFGQKQLYNALGYLARHGFIEHRRYGQYRARGPRRSEHAQS